MNRIPRRLGMVSSCLLSIALVACSDSIAGLDDTPTSAPPTHASLSTSTSEDSIYWAGDHGTFEDGGNQYYLQGSYDSGGRLLSLAMYENGVFLGTIDHQWDAGTTVDQRTTNSAEYSFGVTRNRNHEVVSTWDGYGGGGSSDDCQDGEACMLTHRICGSEMEAAVGATY